MLSVVIGILWIFISLRWQETDDQDPGKLFALEVWQTIWCGCSQDLTQADAPLLGV